MKIRKSKAPGLAKAKPVIPFPADLAGLGGPVDGVTGEIVRHGYTRTLPNGRTVEVRPSQVKRPARR